MINEIIPPFLIVFFLRKMKLILKKFLKKIFTPTIQV
jgi:hypothetical protein